MATTKVTGNLINDLPGDVVATADLDDGVLSADATGRAKMADGFLSADATGRAKMADAFVTTAKIDSGAVDHTKVAAGVVVQLVNTNSGAVATGSTTTPIDDTIPQIGEGFEVMTRSITPLAATNKLVIEVVVIASHPSDGAHITAALFQDATANALAAAAMAQAGANALNVIKFTFHMLAGTTSATTFRVRIGGNSAGTVTFNGNSSNRLFGGVMASSITITEIKA